MFFSTMQLVLAGNDSEGLQYGAIGTEEKFFLQWKEDEADNSRFKLDKYLLKLCNKARLNENNKIRKDYKKINRVVLQQTQKCNNITVYGCNVTVFKISVICRRLIKHIPY